MSISAISSVNRAVIPQPPQRKASETSFGANEEQPQSQYVLQRKRSVGSMIFSFATFFAGALGGDYAARKLILNKMKNVTTLKYMAIAIPCQLIAGSITQILANKLVNKN